MAWADVMTSAESFFDAFNIFGMGLVAVYIIGVIFLSRAITSRKDEFVLMMITLLSAGGILIFADDPGKFVILVVVVVIVLFGMFKLLWSKTNE